MADGLLLLIVGITTVFLFLNVMILVMKLSSKLANYISSSDSSTASQVINHIVSKRVSKLDSPVNKQPLLVAVISAAIHKYKNEHR